MNVVDAIVTKVVGIATFRYGAWWVPVQYDSWGSISESSIRCKDWDEVMKVKPGYKFLA